MQFNCIYVAINYGADAEEMDNEIVKKLVKGDCQLCGHVDNCRNAYVTKI